MLSTAGILAVSGDEETVVVAPSPAADGTLAGTGSEAAGLDVSALQPASKTADRRQRENLFIRDNPVRNVKTGLIICAGTLIVKQFQYLFAELSVGKGWGEGAELVEYLATTYRFGLLTLQFPFTSLSRALWTPVSGTQEVTHS